MTDFNIPKVNVSVTLADVMDKLEEIMSCNEKNTKLMSDFIDKIIESGSYSDEVKCTLDVILSNSEKSLVLYKKILGKILETYSAVAKTVEIYKYHREGLDKQ